MKQSEFLSYEDVRENDGNQIGYVQDNYTDVDLERALDELSDKDKAVVILRYFEDKKLEEIADILDENLSTIKSRLYRSMKKLRGILSDEENGKQILCKEKGR